jgi:hypothetical protein
MYTHDSASAKFSSNSHKMDNSVGSGRLFFFHTIIFIHDTLFLPHIYLLLTMNNCLDSRNEHPRHIEGNTTGGE